MATVKERVKGAEEKTNTDPTEGQKNSGNYKKGKVMIKGFRISIENPVGSIRKGTDKDGNEWETEMPYTYGYFNGTKGKDGDPIDVYLGPVIDEVFDIYVIDQVEEDTRAFDEHKVMFGFESEEQAKAAYAECYEEDWKGFGNITTLSIEKFRKWIRNKDRIKYPAKKLSMDEKIDFRNEIKEDRTKIIQLEGEVLEEITLVDLQEQAGDVSLFDTLIMEIASPGGSVSEGLMIMMWLDSLSKEGKNIITVVTANAYSIASLIMLAADYRMISKHGEVMVHNPMVPELNYANADELEKYAEELRNLEKMMYDIYELFTGLDLETIKKLMDEETYLSAEDAVSRGFADQVIEIEPKPFSMAVNIKKAINMPKTLNILQRVIAMVNKAEFVNQFYYTSEGDELEIFQSDPATYSKGDKTSIEEGEVQLSDGSKLTIKDNEIQEIEKSTETPAEETPEETAEETPEVTVEEAVEEVVSEEVVKETPIAETTVETPAVKQKGDMPATVIETTESTKTTKEVIAKVKPENAEISRISKWEESVVNESFEIGEKVEFKPYDEGMEPTSVGSGEFELEDGRRILTDSEGVIRFIWPAPAVEAAEVAEEVVEEKPAMVEEKPAMVEEKPEVVNEFNEGPAPKKEVMVGEKEEIMAILDKLHGVITVLEEKVTVLEESNAVQAKELQAIKNFEDVATEAIDAIAKNTSSSFQPKAKAHSKTEVGAGKTIFQKMKAQRGIK